MARMRIISGDDAMRLLRWFAFAWAGFCMPASGHAQALSEPLRRPAAPEYDLVALRVEFQPDTTRFSTGDGTFAGDPYHGLAPRVDPLPHDAAYFEAHLSFLEDYVARVSDGKTIVRAHLIPAVVRLPRPMGAYSPTGPDADSDVERAKLARMAYEAWTLAGETIEYDMSRFAPGRTALLLFHAGVGRDTELSGTTLDRTPEDLPSIFFDADALRRLGADGAAFRGFPVDHSMIIPRTETRTGVNPLTGERYLLELSINGLLAASFFSFLGAPDLFDTETGQSAIGPFGLMDALGIFAYAGLFPPEPMAWTRYFLGWTDPVDLIGDGPETVRLRAVSLPDASDAARALVSDAEYFLAENRFRDPQGDGLRLRIFQDGKIIEQHVQNGDSLFNGSTVRGFAGGVVVGTDGYDWALPGGVDSENELNGGVLIWHVDERRLRASLASRSVNAGGVRAIDLEEADGPQDIGYPSGGLFGHRRHLGAPYDFFYEGNPFAPPVGLYRNRFGPDTYPGSETNAGGPSFVVLESFSAPAADMSFVYRREAVDGAVPLDAPALRALQGAFRSLPEGSGLSATEDYVLLYGQDSVAVAARDFTGSAALAGRVPSLAFPAAAPGDRMATFECRREAGAERCAIVVRNLGKPFDEPEAVLDMPPETGAWHPVSPVVHASGPDGEAWHVLLESEAGRAHVQASASGAQVVPDGFGPPLGLAAWRGAEGTAPVAFGSSGVEIGGTTWTWAAPAASDAGAPAVGRDQGGVVAAFPLAGTGEIVLLAPGGVTRRIDVRAAAAAVGRAGKGVLSRYPLLADMDGDDRLDVLATMDSTVFAFTQSGALAAGFPVTLPARIASQLLAFRFEGDEAWTALAAAEDGYLYAVRAGGRSPAPFPLEVGDAVQATPLLIEDRLLAVSATGFAKGWRLPSSPEIWWGSLHGSAAPRNFAALEPPADPSSSSDGLIDSGETYNWPNPIEGGVTHLRIRTFRDAEVRVTILDAGGARVDDVDMGNVVGGAPAETVWRADVQSGLYFARFTARALDGTRATRLIKMAVIR